MEFFLAAIAVEFKGQD